MAIFRAGKRIGPFDIRGGISRGDFKSSAYHKTDRDPRFRMQANVDNTIGRFRSAMNAAEGYARPSRFAIRVFPPVNLKEQVLGSQLATYNNGEVNSSGFRSQRTIDRMGGQNVDGRYMNDLNSSFGRSVNINCDTISMPGKDLQTQEVQYGSEPTRSMVQTHAYAGNIEASFFADKYIRERQLF